MDLPKNSTIFVQLSFAILVFIWFVMTFSQLLKIKMNSLRKISQNTIKMDQDQSQMQILVHDASESLKRNNNQGLWSIVEQEKYIIFLQLFRNVFHSRQKRKEGRIFKKMSEFLKTRNCIQCRSHHMKQLKTHKEKVRNIISEYRKKVDREYWSRKIEEAKFILGVPQEKKPRSRLSFSEKMVEEDKESKENEEKVANNSKQMQEVRENQLRRAQQIYQSPRLTEEVPSEPIRVFWCFFVFPI